MNNKYFKVFNIFSHQRTANGNCLDTPSHSRQNGKEQENNKR